MKRSLRATRINRAEAGCCLTELCRHTSRAHLTWDETGRFFGHPLAPTPKQTATICSGAYEGRAIPSGGVRRRSSASARLFFWQLAAPRETISKRSIKRRAWALITGRERRRPRPPALSNGD